MSGGNPSCVVAGHKKEEEEWPHCMDCTSRSPCDAEQSMLKGEDAEPTKGSSLKEVDAPLDLLIIIVSGIGVDHQQRSTEQRVLKMWDV